MTKLTKEIYQIHAKRMQAILNEQSSFLAFLSRQDFAKIIENELDILAVLETKFPNDLLETKYLAKSLNEFYNTKTNKKYELNLKHPYEDEADLIDAINYLVTFCKNIFKVDLDEVVAGKKVTATAPNINFNETRSAEGSAGNGFGAGMMGGLGMEQMGGVNPFVLSKATNKIQEELASGQLYRFNSKPKAIPIIKLVAIVMLLLTSLGLIAFAIVAFIANGLKITYTDDGSAGQLPLIASGMIYLVLTAFTAYDAAILIKSLCKTRRYKKVNDNDKYVLMWPYILMAVVLGMIMIAFDARIAFNTSFLVASDNPAVKLNAFKEFKVLWIVCMSLFGSCLVPMIVGAVMNPKPNNEIVENRLQQLMSEFAGVSTPTTTVDVQKPVEVKPVEETKKEDNKKPEGEQPKK